MEGLIRSRALAYVARERAWQAETRRTYERECEDYRREGYRPHYCIHGSDQWTDYDNICHGCEEYGNNLPPMLDVYTDALYRARQDVENFLEAHALAVKIGLHVGHDMAGAIVDVAVKRYLHPID